MRQGITGEAAPERQWLIVVSQGYNAAFLALAVVATTAFLLVLVALPETVNLQDADVTRPATSGG